MPEEDRPRSRARSRRLAVSWLMAEPETDHLVRDLLDYGMMIFKGMKVMASNVSDNAVATSALISALSEQNPELADSYQRQFDSQRNTAPLAKTIAELCAQFDVATARLQV